MNRMERAIESERMLISIERMTAGKNNAVWYAINRAKAYGNHPAYEAHHERIAAILAKEQEVQNELNALFAPDKKTLSNIEF